MDLFQTYFLITKGSFQQKDSASVDTIKFFKKREREKNNYGIEKRK